MWLECHSAKNEKPLCTNLDLRCSVIKQPSMLQIDSLWTIIFLQSSPACYPISSVSQMTTLCAVPSSISGPRSIGLRRWAASAMSSARTGTCLTKLLELSLPKKLSFWPPALRARRVQFEARNFHGWPEASSLVNRQSLETLPFRAGASARARPVPKWFNSPFPDC